MGRARRVGRGKPRQRIGDRRHHVHQRQGCRQQQRPGGGITGEVVQGGEGGHHGGVRAVRGVEQGACRLRGNLNAVLGDRGAHDGIARNVPVWTEIASLGLQGLVLGLHLCEASVVRAVPLRLRTLALHDDRVDGGDGRAQVVNHQKIVAAKFLGAQLMARRAAKQLAFAQGLAHCAKPAFQQLVELANGLVVRRRGHQYLWQKIAGRPGDCPCRGRIALLRSLRTLEKDEVVEGVEIKRRQCQFHCRRVVSLGHREIGSVEVGSHPDRKAEVGDLREVGHLLYADSHEFFAPCRHMRQFVSGQSFVDGGLEAEGCIQIAAQDVVLQFRRLCQDVHELFTAMHVHPPPTRALYPLRLGLWKRRR